jgi:hypothetical protein
VDFQPVGFGDVGDGILETISGKKQALRWQHQHSSIPAVTIRVSELHTHTADVQIQFPLPCAIWRPRLRRSRCLARRPRRRASSVPWNTHGGRQPFHHRTQRHSRRDKKP